MAGLTKAQKEAKAAAAIKLAEEQKQAEQVGITALLDKAVALSGLSIADFESLSEEDRKTWIELANEQDSETKPNVDAVTREQLDAALAQLPGGYTDAEYVVTNMRNHFGELFTADDEAKVRELVKLPENEAAKAAQAKADAEDAEAKRLVDEKEAKKSSGVLPESVKLASPYGYDPEIEGQPHKMWACGQVVTDPDEIKDLISRGAPLEEEV